MRPFGSTHDPVMGLIKELPLVLEAADVWAVGALVVVVMKKLETHVASAEIQLTPPGAVAWGPASGRA